MAGIVKLHGASPNAVNLGPSFKSWMEAAPGARKPGSAYAVTGPSGRLRPGSMATCAAQQPQQPFHHRPAQPPDLPSSPARVPTRNVSYVLEPAQVPASVLNKILPNLSTIGIMKDAGWDGKLTEGERGKIEALGEVRHLAPRAPRGAAAAGAVRQAPLHRRHGARLRPQRHLRPAHFGLWPRATCATSAYSAVCSWVSV